MPTETQGNEHKAVVLGTFCRCTACTPTGQIWLYQIKSQVTQPLIRVDFILVMPVVSWWPAPTLQNSLKWINTLKIHILFFHLKRKIVPKISVTTKMNFGAHDHQMQVQMITALFTHMAVVGMSDSPWSSFGLKWRSISEHFYGLLFRKTSHTRWDYMTTNTCL